MRKSSVLVVVLFVLVFALACNVAFPGQSALPPSPAPSPTPTAQTLPPTVVETVPPAGSQVGLQSPITIYFSEPMERGSVEAALHSPQAERFLFIWLDDATVQITPVQPFRANTDIAIVLGTAARTARGLALPRELTLTYRTPGALRVSQVLPAPQSDAISPDSAVVATFNQPVVPLGADPASLPPGFTLEPAVNGRGEWLNTSTYIFYPQPGLAGGVEYVARVNPQLKSTAGTALDADSPNRTWSFRVAMPAVVELSPATRTLLPIDGKIQITFNQPMDRASVQAAFSLQDASGRPVAGQFSWNERGNILTFTPDSPLPRETAFTLTLSGTARALGGTPLGSDLRADYITYQNFSFRGTNIPEGAVRSFSDALTFSFSAPLPDEIPAEIQRQIRIEPAPYDWSVYPQGTDLQVHLGFEPGRAYTITLPAALTDRWGQPLGQDIRFSFRQPDAIPQLTYGMYSEALRISPDSPVVNVRAVNIETIRLVFGEISLPQFLTWMTDAGNRSAISPSAPTRLEIRPSLPRNENRLVELRLSNAPLQPGVYLFRMDSPNVRYPDSSWRLLLVSHVNLTVKNAPGEILVWAVDNRTLQPVANTPVQVFDQNGEVAVSGLTDSQGLWRGALPQNRAARLVLLGRPGEELFSAVSPEWNLGVEPPGFFHSDWLPPRVPFAYLYSDRPIYRPGDTVRFWGALRERFDARYELFSPSKLTASMNDFNTGAEIYREMLSLSPFGTFHSQFTLPASLPPSMYSLELNAAGGKPLQNGSLTIQVADYRKPEINLSVMLTPSPAQSGQPLRAEGSAEYFFGAPVRDLPFEWNLYSEQASFDLSDYQTGVWSDNWFAFDKQFRSVYASGAGRTDGNGRFVIPLENIQVTDTTQLILEITATESGGFPVSARASVIVHPASFYIGIRPQAWFGQAGTPLFFDLLTADWEAHPLAGKPLTLEFKRVRWEPSQHPYDTRLVPVYEPGQSQTLQTDAEGRAKAVFIPDSAGTYLLEVVSGAAKTQVLLWVGGAQNAPWPNLPADRLSLTPDKTEYAPGETAEVFIPNFFNQSVPMLLSTERGTLRSVQIVSLPPEGYRWKLPLTEAEAPNIYLAATVLGPDGRFRQGYLNLRVDPSALELNVTLKATPEKARPGETVTLDLLVTDARGQPVQGQFALGVVDLAVLALSPPNSEDILPAFYSVQPLHVGTALTAAIDMRRLLPAGGLGGGGGDEDVLRIRENFPDTALWQADIVTDAQGRARLTLTLPDSLTTWQVETRGLTKDTKVGQARVRVVAGKDLLIRPQTPRFLVVGDVTELTALVNNTTSQPIQAVVSLKAEGIVLEAGVQPEQTVTVPAGGSVRVSWRGSVQDVEAVDAVFAVRAEGFQDAARPNDGKIPVFRYTAPQTFSTAGVLSASDSTLTEIIAVPRTFQPQGGKLKLELSPSLAAAILNVLEARPLPEPAFSTEQILSYLLPNTVTYATLRSVGLENASLRARLEREIPAQTSKLLAAQQPDGGWGWALNADRSDAFITAYLLFGLEQVRRSGLADTATLTDAIERGRLYLSRETPLFTREMNLNDPGQTNQAMFYLFVLQETGGLNNSSMLETLYGQRGRLDPWAKAMLAVALTRVAPSDDRSRTLFSDVEAAAVRSATGAYWESAQSRRMVPASPLYTTAVVLYALTERDPANPLVADAARYLAAQRGPKGWASEYENAWVLLALNRLMAATGEFRADFGFSAAFNGVNVAEGQAAGPQNLTSVTADVPLSQIAWNGANQLTISRAAGVGRLYYRAALEVLRPVETAPALQQGISITREYLHCTQQGCQPVTSFLLLPNTTARLTVRLTVTLPHDGYYFLLEDFIPAGAELLDPSLLTSQQGPESLSAQILYQTTDPFLLGSGWSFFSQPQLYRERILWRADYLPAGTYVLSYTLIPSIPGEYRVLPAHAWLAFFPEVQGTTQGTVFRIERAE